PGHLHRVPEPDPGQPGLGDQPLPDPVGPAVGGHPGQRHPRRLALPVGHRGEHRPGRGRGGPPPPRGGPHAPALLSAGPSATIAGMLRTFGRRTFDFARRVAVMAILNRTPDSFYDRGDNFGVEAALAPGERALAEAADWLDVGGVKAGPGPPVSQAEELDRVVPLVGALRERTDAVISVDTFRPGAGRRAAGGRGD